MPSPCTAASAFVKLLPIAIIQSLAHSTWNWNSSAELGTPETLWVPHVSPQLRDVGMMTFSVADLRGDCHEDICTLRHLAADLGKLALRRRRKACHLQE